MTVIYLLSINSIPFYIGKTIEPLKRERKHKLTYPDSLFEIIDEVQDIDWKFWERHYISLFRSWGFDLLNKNFGGGGSHFVTDETRKKISELKKGNKNCLGLKLSPEHKQKLSNSLKGHKGHNFSEEEKRKMSDSHKGLVSGNKGKKCTIEVKNKISDGMKGKKWNDERRKKLSLLMLMKNEKRKSVINSHNKIFSSIKDAANEYKISPSYLASMLRGESENKTDLKYEKSK